MPKTAAEALPDLAPYATTLTQVRLGDLAVDSEVQRELRDRWVNDLVLAFDPRMLGVLNVSQRDDGTLRPVDGQHRAETMNALGYDPDTKVDAKVYTGLSLIDEAELFLGLNNTKNISAYDKFRVALKAGRSVETAIAATLDELGLRVALDSQPGSISAPGTLVKIYNQLGSDVLDRTLLLIRDAFGDDGLQAMIIDGVSLVVHRYNGRLDMETAIDKLSTMHGGAEGLLGQARALKRQMGNPLRQCVAAATVQNINGRQQGGRRLANWWKPVAPTTQLRSAG